MDDIREVVGKACKIAAVPDGIEFHDDSIYGEHRPNEKEHRRGMQENAFI